MGLLGDGRGPFGLGPEPVKRYPYPEAGEVRSQPGTIDEDFVFIDSNGELHDGHLLLDRRPWVSHEGDTGGRHVGWVDYAGYKGRPESLLISVRADGDMGSNRWELLCTDGIHDAVLGIATREGLVPPGFKRKGMRVTADGGYSI